MNKYPLLSVIMPVYNCQKYLKDSIESVLDQSYRNFEFIIINDGSTDNSIKIINSFNDDRIKLISNVKNSGIVYSLNRGINLSSGDFIARMDADDICVKDRFACQLDFLFQNKDIGLCSGHIIKIDSYGDNLGEVKFPISDQDCNMMFLFGNPIVHPAAMYRKDLVLKVGGYSVGSEPAEDLDLWLKIAAKTKISNLNKVLLKYRVHEQNYSLVKRNNYREKLNTIFDKFDVINKFIPSDCKFFYGRTVIGSWSEKTCVFELKKMSYIKNHILLSNKDLKYFNQNTLSNFVNLKLTHILLAIIKSNTNGLKTRIVALLLLFKFDIRNVVTLLKSKNI